jgi:hypothetical protein
LGELAALFNQSADFSAQPAGGDPKVLSPTAAVAQGKAPKRSKDTPGKPPAERLQARHVPTLPEILSAQVDMEVYERAVAQGQGAQWLEEHANQPIRAGEANKAILALMRHNERAQQQGQLQSKAGAAAAAKGGHEQPARSSRHHSPDTTVPQQTAATGGGEARQQTAATVRESETRRTNPATTSFSRIHEAVGQLNAQSHALDGISSISNASSETRPHDGNLNRLARELDPRRIA